MTALPIAHWIIWSLGHTSRFGAMLSVRNDGEMHGLLGSRGRTYRLSVWTNPRKDSR